MKSAMKNVFLDMTEDSKPSIKRSFRLAQEASALRDEGLNYMEIGKKLDYTGSWISMLLRQYDEYLEAVNEVVREEEPLEEIKVSDLACMSYLSHVGFRQNKIGRNGDGKVAYFFDGTPELKKALTDFWEDRGMVNARTYAATLRSVKYSIYTYQNPQADSQRQYLGNYAK